MGGMALAHIAAVYRHAVTGQPQHIGHLRIVDARAVVGVLLGDREGAERRHIGLVTVIHHGGADLRTDFHLHEDVD